jgi:hypothetical protein
LPGHDAVSFGTHGYTSSVVSQFVDLARTCGRTERTAAATRLPFDSFPLVDLAQPVSQTPVGDQDPGMVDLKTGGKWISFRPELKIADIAMP